MLGRRLHIVNSSDVLLYELTALIVIRAPRAPNSVPSSPCLARACKGLELSHDIHAPIARFERGSRWGSQRKGMRFRGQGPTWWWLAVGKFPASAEQGTGGGKGRSGGGSVPGFAWAGGRRSWRGTSTGRTRLPVAIVDIVWGGAVGGCGRCDTGVPADGGRWGRALEGTCPCLGAT